MFLYDFDSITPPFTLVQQEALPWLAALHSLKDPAGSTRLLKLLRRYGCSAEKIRTRHSILADFLLHDPDKRQVLRMANQPSGEGMSTRMEVYRQASEEAFRTWYPTPSSIFPDDIIHVSCTGYLSPSAPQVVLSEHGRGSTSRVTHAYHMGCYAAFPALRMAKGFLASGSKTVDIAHTEYCTLHVDPANDAPDQLVVHTLFSDGMIRYRAAPERVNLSGFDVLCAHEQLIDASTDQMSWKIADHGMRMGLSRDVPARVSAVLSEFMAQLVGRAERAVGRDAPPFSCVAVHPGGPRIIDVVRDTLQLTEQQVSASRKVLLNFGNMSSATLPHIWKEILEDSSVPDGQWIPSVAFGPGLTISGAILRKRIRS